MFRCKLFSHIAIMICLMGFAGARNSGAAVSAEEAAKLTSVLTPIGAERAGNQDGTIPEWKGGIRTVPSDYHPFYDFFPNEKPLFSIDAENMDKYVDKLTDGVKNLLKRYPDSFRMDVYPTHRSAGADEWVYENTLKNAVRAKTENNGLTIAGAFGGVPFPIPKTGNEIIWNHLVGFGSESNMEHFKNWLITDAGTRTLTGESRNTAEFPYLFKEGSIKTYCGTFVRSVREDLYPPYQAGNRMLVSIFTNNPRYVTRAFQYLAGQRRVKRLPNVEFDTPDAGTCGITFYDEAQMFMGSPALFDWKIEGKKEIYIPYNCSRMYRQNVDDVLQKHNPNPDYVRWELHRVWVVDATLLPGRRHVVPHKRFYIDEDTWQAVMFDGWDAQGKHWRSGFLFLFPDPKIMMPATHALYCIHDLRRGAYIAANCQVGVSPDPYDLEMPRKPASYYSQAGLAAGGVR